MHSRLKPHNQPIITTQPPSPIVHQVSPSLSSLFWSSHNTIQHPSTAQVITIGLSLQPNDVGSAAQVPSSPRPRARYKNTIRAIINDAPSVFPKEDRRETSVKEGRWWWWWVLWGLAGFWFWLWGWFLEARASEGSMEGSKVRSHYFKKCFVSIRFKSKFYLILLKKWSSFKGIYLEMYFRKKRAKPIILPDSSPRRNRQTVAVAGAFFMSPLTQVAQWLLP